MKQKGCKRSGRMTVAITNPTIAPLNRQQIKEFIQENTEYQLIPSIPKLYHDSTWQTIEELLPYTIGKLIDVMLPFEHKNHKGQWCRHQARYFLLNRRVLGIRIKTARSLWKRYETEQIHLPPSISNLYQGQDKQAAKFCIAGEFYLSFNQIKLAPLFESQIKIDNKIITEYQKYGCEVFSVVDNQARDAVIEKNQDIQKHFLGKNIVLLYSGVKTGYSFSETYWTNAVIKQGKQIYKVIYNHPFEEGQTIIDSIDIKIMRKDKVYPPLTDLQAINETSTKVINYLDCCDQFIKLTPSEAANPSSKSVKEFKQSVKVQLLHIWYLFNAINKCKPFLIDLPCQRKTLSLLYLINQLYLFMKKTGIKKNKNLVCAFKRKNDDEEMEETSLWPELFETKNYLKLVFEKSLEEKWKTGEEMFVYCEGEEDIKFWHEKAKKFENIYLCNFLLSDRFYKVKVDSQFLREKDQPVIQHTQRGLQKICDQIIMKKFNTISEMIEHFLNRESDVEKLTEAFVKIIPKKLKKKFSLHPPYVSLINLSPSAIEEILRDLQTDITINRSKQSVSIEGQERRATVDMKVRESKYWKAKNKPLYSVCHSCEEVVKKQLVVSCKNCKKVFCYECLSNNNAILNDDLEEFMKNIESKCAYCNKFCRCTFCLEVKKNKEMREREERDRYKTKIAEQAVKSIVSTSKCQICVMAKRSDRKQIAIECSSCERQYCWQCQKLDEQFPTSYLQEWVCKKCKKVIEEKNNKDKFLEEQKLQKILTLNYNQTPAGIKQRIEEEEKNRKIAEYLYLNQNRNSFEEENDSPSRSRNKRKSQSIGREDNRVQNSFRPQIDRAPSNPPTFNGFQGRQDQSQLRRSDSRDHFNDDRNRDRERDRGNNNPNFNNNNNRNSDFNNRGWNNNNDGERRGGRGGRGRGGRGRGGPPREKGSFFNRGNTNNDENNKSLFEQNGFNDQRNEHRQQKQSLWNVEAQKNDFKNPRTQKSNLFVEVQKKPQDVEQFDY